MIKWFSLAARKILESKMKLPKQNQKSWIDIKMMSKN